MFLYRTYAFEKRLVHRARRIWEKLFPDLGRDLSAHITSYFDRDDLTTFSLVCKVTMDQSTSVSNKQENRKNNITDTTSDPILYRKFLLWDDIDVFSNSIEEIVNSKKEKWGFVNYKVTVISYKKYYIINFNLVTS